MATQEETLQKLSEQLEKKGEELQKLSDQVEQLENSYHADKKMVKGVGVVFGILVVAFFGVTLQQIPSKVRSALDEKLAKEVQSQLKEKVPEATTEKIEATMVNIEKINSYEEQLKKLIAQYQQDVVAQGDANEQAIARIQTDISAGGKNWEWCNCENVDWGLSFDRQGLSECKEGFFIVGLERAVTKCQAADALGCLEGAKCCQPCYKPDN